MQDGIQCKDPPITIMEGLPFCLTRQCRSEPQASPSIYALFGPFGVGMVSEGVLSQLRHGKTKFAPSHRGLRHRRQRPGLIRSKAERVG